MNKNGVRQSYKTIDSSSFERAAALQYVGQMNTFNHPNDTVNTVQYGTSGVVLNNGISTLLYYEPLPEFGGIDSFYYMFDIVDLATGEVLQTGKRSVVTVVTAG